MYPYDFKPKKNFIDLYKVFVAMPFHYSYEHIYTDLIAPSINRVNVKRKKNEKLFLYRAKDPKHLRSGWLDILENLHTSRIVIGVLTGDNANVFYELGIAHTNQQIERQILIAPKGYKVKFDLKDLIYREYNPNKLANSITELSKAIRDTLKLYDFNNDRMISLAESRLSYYEFEIIGKFSSVSHFILPVNSPRKHYDGVAQLCHAGLLRLSTKPEVIQRKIEFSYYWTNIGNAVLRKLMIIDDIELRKRILDYKKFFIV